MRLRNSINLKKNLIRPVSLIAILGSLIFLSSCELLEFSPHEADLPEEYRNLNSRNIARIQSSDHGETLKIAITGDSQRYYEHARNMVDDINSRDDIDFLIHTGDFTDFGVEREFTWMADIFLDLDIPWVVVIGNHDLVANGKVLYEQMFGSENFFFDLNDYRFVFFDSNSREAGFDGRTPNLNWLRSVQDSTKRLVAVAHIPTYNHDFDPHLVGEYKALLNDELKVELKINGHHHDYGAGVLQGTNVDFINTMSCSKEKYMILELSNDSSQHDTGFTHSHEIINF